MLWKTKLTKIENGREIVRGRALEELIRGSSFSAAIFFLLLGREPSDAERRVFDALLVAAIDHGVGAPSATVARTVVSCGNSMNVSLAAGALALGENHGGAIGGAARFFAAHKDEEDVSGLVANMKAEKVRIPGYGHKILEIDRRAETIFEIAENERVAGPYCKLARRIEEALNKISSKHLPLNIDGAMAAVLLDMGFPPRIIGGVFVIARMPGLVAHVVEEMNSGAGVRRIDESEIEYEDT